MTNPKRIVRTFAPFGKTGQAVSLPQAWHPFAPAGENFMGVALVADVPNQPVIGGIEYTVQGKGQFYGAEASGEVSSRLTDRMDEKLA